MTALRLEGLTRRYGSFVAVDGVGLEIDSGEMVALLGPSGAGKTTTLELIAGLQRLSAGDIKLDGHSVIEEAPERRRIVLMLQNPSLFPYMSIGRNTAFSLKMRHTPRAEADRAASQMLERVGLAGFEERQPAELSGGEQQRVALARPSGEAQGPPARRAPRPPGPRKCAETCGGSSARFSKRPD